DPRPDTVVGGSWRDVVGRLAQGRDLGGGARLPDGAKTLDVTARIASDASFFRLDFDATLQVRDGHGTVHGLPAGRVSTRTSRLSADLGAAGLTPPLTLVGLSVPLPDWVDNLDADPTLGLEVDRVVADGSPVPGLDSFSDDSSGLGLWWAAAPARTAAVPALVTRDVAAAIAAAGSDTVVLALGPRDVPVTVAGVLDVLPTAEVPSRGVVVDLAALAAAPDTVGGGSSQRSRALFEPGEWWADPSDPAATVATVRAEAPYGTTVVSRQEVARDRLATPVNAGMRAAMLLVTLASVVLAAVGFAATTAALGRTRRHENAVLLALGTAPRRLRTVLQVERVVVVVATVLVGVALGVVAALTVVPLLVGGDGHQQVPSVEVALPVGQVLVLALAIIAVLSVVGVLVLRSTSKDLAAELREGEAP
ncbi:MAG TPA: FtsX-like permease family protein, partial [Phycicoccus sp.]